MEQVNQLLKEQQAWIRQSIKDFEMRQDEKLDALRQQFSELIANQNRQQRRGEGSGTFGGNDLGRR